MFERIKNYFKERDRKRKILFRKQRRERLRKVLQLAKQTKNEGLLRRQLIDLPRVSRVDTASGGFRKAFVDVTMTDGYTITTSDFWIRNALKKAIAEVVNRLRQ